MWRHQHTLHPSKSTPNKKNIFTLSGAQKKCAVARALCVYLFLLAAKLCRLNHSELRKWALPGRHSRSKISTTMLSRLLHQILVKKNFEITQYVTRIHYTYIFSSTLGCVYLLPHRHGRHCATKLCVYACLIYIYIYMRMDCWHSKPNHKGYILVSV